MNRVIRVLTTLTLIVFCFFSSFAGDLKVGETYHGFKLLEKRFVKEVNAECLYFEHVKSGARLFKIASDDPNKTFSIGFKTDPESDCGTPHIMEHSVLNGSKNYPVKSPFDVLSKGSLITYLNAWTGGDFTCYPFASMNNKDYFNVLGVYLDAVFNPLIYSDPRILKQEGWHYEMDSTNGSIAYKGVVYNEMKGSYSNPVRVLNHYIYRYLFPDNGYRFSSGGYPPSIPKLTYEMFLDFHKRYYHPVNSHILLYGNADLDKELAFIDKEYLSKYDLAKRPVSFPIQKPFDKMKEESGYYPATEGSSTENQTYLTLNFVAGLNSDRATTMALTILADLLVNQEAAPLRLALQKAGIGQDVNATLDENQQNIFEITVQNANAKDKDKFREIVMNTLAEVAKTGLDKKAIEGALNRTEFQLREGNDAQKGVTYNFQILPGWFFANDPYLTLEYEKPLAKLKTALETNYLESIMQKYILENPHALLMVLEPKPGLEKENNAIIEKELADYKASLSQQEKEKLVKETKELIANQKKEDTPEALAKIPLIERKDINPKADWYSIVEKKISGVTVLRREEFTNDVVYARLLFNARVLPQELIQYAALLTNVLGSQNTEKYSYGDLDKELNIHTGGFNSFFNTYLENQEDSKMIPMFIVESKAMNKKVNKLFELVGEIINKTRYNDADRLKEIIVRLQSRLDSQVKQNGYGFARTRLASYCNNSGMFGELTGGIEFYRFISDLAKNFDSKKAEIIEKLTNCAALLFNKNNLTASVTCGKLDDSAYNQSLEKFIPTLSNDVVKYNDWKLQPEKKNEGFLTASKVQFVIKGYDFSKLGYKWNGKMRVLEQILSTDWLQNRIRVIGGAYGGFCNFTTTGQMFFNSYRDPNLKETLDNYDAIPDYLDKLDVNDKDMTRYIIGTVANLDNPLTASQKGNVALRNYLEKNSYQEVQKDRDAVLSTTLADIKGMKKFIADIMNQKTYCVYGNEEKIKAAKELFGEIEPLSE
jgi:Zn-dependent M16 (insulinase) family peptidase